MSALARTAMGRLGTRAAVRRAYWSLIRARFAVDALRLNVAVQRWSPTAPRPRERLNVIVLSYRRPGNIEPIVRGVLACDFVRALVVCNNNPAVAIEDWVTSASPRLHLINQPERSFPMRRFEIARDMPGEFFLALDDDVFFRPRQTEALFLHLLDDPAVPHGVVGLVKHDGTGPGATRAFHVLERRDADVDVLNRAYLFTAAHRDRFFTRLAALQTISADRSPLRFGDDIVLSFRAERKARIHDVGRVVYCPSSDDDGLARWKEPGAHEYRIRLHDDLQSLPCEARSHTTTASR